MTDQQEEERAGRAFQKALCDLVGDHLERGGAEMQVQILAVLTAETVRGCVETGLPLEAVLHGIRVLYGDVPLTRKPDEEQAP